MSKIAFVVIFSILTIACGGSQSTSTSGYQTEDLVRAQVDTMDGSVTVRPRRPIMPFADQSRPFGPTCQIQPILLNGIRAFRVRVSYNGYHDYNIADLEIRTGGRYYSLPGSHGNYDIGRHITTISSWHELPQDFSINPNSPIVARCGHIIQNQLSTRQAHVWNAVFSYRSRRAAILNLKIKPSQIASQVAIDPSPSFRMARYVVGAALDETNTSITRQTR